MAEAIFSAVVGDAVSRGIGLLARQFSHRHRHSAESKLRAISPMLIRIHSAVEEAKALQIENHGTLQWLMELINSEYQGRHLLDTIGCDDHEVEDDDDDGDEHDDEGVAVAPLQAFSLSLLNPAKRVQVVAACALKKALSRRRRRNVGDEDVDRVLEKLQGASADLSVFIMLLQGNQRRIHRPLATNIFLDGQMFGRHVEKEMIVNFLLHDGGGGSGAEVGVLLVLGDSGVGKTTLVQHACDDSRVSHRFPTIILFTFSTFHGRWTANQQRSRGGNGDFLATSVDDPLEFIEGNKNLRDKKLLMVFEDVDDTCKRRILEKLHLKRGSKVIVTTNNWHVAASVGTVEPLVLKVLPYPEYWFLFKAHAFAGRDVEDDARLVAAGKAISRKMKGSFFGAKIIGGLLRDHPDPRFWCSVLRSGIGGLSRLGDGVNYVADLAENLWPDRVILDTVTISKKPMDGLEVLAKFRDLCEVRGSEATLLAQDSRSAKVLMCKSVVPFYNLFYVAYLHCWARRLM